MANALVLADDFTGAMDTGYSFASRGRSVRVSLEAPTTDPPDRSDPGAPDVLAIDVDSRDVEGGVASAAVAARLEGIDGSPIVYKKIDSTLRGNVVEEVDAAIGATDADLAVVAPAFPSTGRVTVAGRHLVDGRPLEEAGYGSQSQSEVPSLFGRSRYEVTTLPIETVVDGLDAVRSALASCVRDDPTIVVCDAIHDRHLRAIATGAEALAADVLFVGSGGLATAVSVPGDSRTTGNAVGAPAADGGALAVVGSVNDRTLEQLAAVPDEIVYKIDPGAAVGEPERTGRNAAAELETRLRTHGRAVVTGATASADVDRAGTVASELDVDPGARVARSLGTAAAITVAKASPSGLFLTGGAVARAALDELSATAIDLSGEAVVDGIPEGRIADGPAAGLPIVTKAGGFGDERSIVNCLNFLGETDDRS